MDVRRPAQARERPSPHQGINEARAPRFKRLPDFNIDAAPFIGAATLGHLSAGGHMDAGEPVVLLGEVEAADDSILSHVVGRYARGTCSAWTGLATSGRWGQFREDGGAKNT